MTLALANSLNKEIMSILSPDEINLRIGELQKYKLDLNTDPTVQGLNSINDKLAESQNNLNVVNQFVQEALYNRTQAEIVARRKELIHDMKLSELLATDADVQNQKSEKLREAVAKTKMAEMVLELHYAELDLYAAEAYFKMSMQEYNNLLTANSTLSRQITVEQLRVGAEGQGHFNGASKQITIKPSGGQ